MTRTLATLTAGASIALIVTGTSLVLGARKIRKALPL